MRFLVDPEKVKPVLEGYRPCEVETGVLSWDSPSICIQKFTLFLGMHAEPYVEGRMVLEHDEEDEYIASIRRVDVEPLLGRCTNRNKFKRYLIQHKWTIDLYDTGVGIASIEVDGLDEPEDKPEWLGKRISWDPAFSSVVQKNPFLEF